MLVDSHCHLDLLDNQNIPSIIKRASNNNVKVLHTICTAVSKFKKILEISKCYENVFCSIGNHPLNIEKEGIINIKDIMPFSNNNKLISIGETGLDYYYSQQNAEAQKKSFIQHIIASQELSLPIIVHTRSADEDTVAILKKYMKIKKFSGVIHCFTASEWLAKECINMGLYISASGIVTFNNARRICDTFKRIPLEKLLLETDAPYLAPAPVRGTINEPSNLKYTALFMSQLLKIDLNLLINTTSQNFFKLFHRANKWKLLS